MNLHKNARLTPQGRHLPVQRITEQGWTVSAAGRAAGLSGRQAYRWLARYRAGGTAALVDRSSAPKHCRHGVPAARVAEIERWRHQRLSGPAIARQDDQAERPERGEQPDDRGQRPWTRTSPRMLRLGPAPALAQPHAIELHPMIGKIAERL